MTGSMITAMCHEDGGKPCDGGPVLPRTGRAHSGLEEILLDLPET